MSCKISVSSPSRIQNMRPPIYRGNNDLPLEAAIRSGFFILLLAFLDLGTRGGFIAKYSNRSGRKSTKGNFHKLIPTSFAITAKPFLSIVLLVFVDILSF